MERLQRILAARGVASRRKAEEMITAGRVTVDGQVVTALGTKADPIHADIRVDGKRLRAQQPRYIVLNKPSGYITTMKDERDRWTVMDLVQTRERVYPVGRLDRDTEGLLLLTNDGNVANRVMHPRYELDKEYQIVTTIRPTEAMMQRVRSGITIEEKKIVPHEFRIFRETREGLILTITLHEGVNHVVRRMMEAAGIPIQRLRRIRVGPLNLTGVPLGGWRDLTPGECSTLFEAIGLSRKATAEAETTARPRPSQSRTIQFTRRPPNPRPVRPQGEAEAPRSPSSARPQRFSQPSASPTPRPDYATKPDPGDVRSRRRKGEPPAPAPRRQKPERTASGRNESATDQRGRPTKTKKPTRGANDEQQRGGGPQPGGRTKQRAPESGGNRRPRGGGQDNGGKPRRRTPRRDAV